MVILYVCQLEDFIAYKVANTLNERSHLGTFGNGENLEKYRAGLHVDELVAHMLSSSQ